MTRFVVVPGLFTGAQVWRETVEGLRAAGAQVEVVEVPREGAGEDGGGVDLEAHVARVLAAIDAAGRGVVLVGHEYGVFPAVAAADRRADRIARVVYVDGPLVQDGAVGLSLIPDPDLRERLSAEDLLPARGDWSRWGSTAGLSDAQLDRLTALATPQPAGTLLQPIRLTGAAALLPTTGVLCAESGASIETVRMMVQFGDPALKEVLARPEVTFFELPTGHWPMLSRPRELAEALLKAAAGEGVTLAAETEGGSAAAQGAAGGPAEGAAVGSADGSARTPGYLRPFLLDVPELAPERHGNIDFFLPEASKPRPAVVIVHGGPVAADLEPAPREWPTLVGYARLAASHGAVGVTLNHRLHDVRDYQVAIEDLTAAVAQIRADPRVDESRIALWFFSGSGPMTTPWLAAPPAWLRCLAANYPIMAPLPNWGLPPGQFRPAEVIAKAAELPMVLLRAGLETSAIARTVEEFVTAARAADARLEIIDVPNGHHAFEGLDQTDESRAAVRQAMAWVLARVGLA